MDTVLEAYRDLWYRIGTPPPRRPLYKGPSAGGKGSVGSWQCRVDVDLLALQYSIAYRSIPIALLIEYILIARTEVVEIRSRRSRPKSAIREIRELSAIWLRIFQACGRVSTSSRWKCSLLGFELEDDRVWGINLFFAICPFCFYGVLWSLNSEKVNFDAEKVANLPTAKYRFVHHCAIRGYSTVVNISRSPTV